MNYELKHIEFDAYVNNQNIQLIIDVALFTAFLQMTAKAACIMRFPRSPFIILLIQRYPVKVRNLKMRN